MTLQVSVGQVCHLGVGEAHGGRRRNEDNLLVCRDGRVRWWEEAGGLVERAQAGTGVLLAVCDGMGGHANGDVASSTAVRVLSKLYQSEPPKSPARVLVNYVHESHRSLHRAATQHGPVTMGTTLTAAWLLDTHVYWVQVGDSRLYLLRGDRLFQLTSDQTRNEFARRDGRPTGPDGAHLAQCFIYGSRGLGHDHALRLDKGIDAGAEPLERGDLLLLCSDGLSGAVDEAGLVRALRAGGDPQALAEALVARALAAPTLDNVTAVVARVDEVPARTEDWFDDPEETVQF
jgi:serine/threonine protein phosphatase PrpC